MIVLSNCNFHILYSDVLVIWMPVTCWFARDNKARVAYNITPLLVCIGATIFNELLYESMQSISFNFDCNVIRKGSCDLCSYLWIFNELVEHVIVTGRPLTTCRLFQKSKREAANFDAEFTKEEPVLTPVPADVVRTINQVLACALCWLINLIRARALCWHVNLIRTRALCY